MKDLIKNQIQILAVDDNHENLRTIGTHLKDEGYQFTLAANAENALKILGVHKVDIILLDVMMPGMDGFELCRRIKSEPTTRDIPVIFLTADTETSSMVEGFQSGGVDFITKPFRKEELYVRLNNHIELKLLRDYFKSQAEMHKLERNKYMRLLLDMGKSIEKIY